MPWGQMLLARLAEWWHLRGFETGATDEGAEARGELLCFQERVEVNVIQNEAPEAFFKRNRGTFAGSKQIWCSVFLFYFFGRLPRLGLVIRM